MNVKLMFSGVLSIIGLVITISSLALAQDMLSNMTEQLTDINPVIGETFSQTNLYCVKASDCKQDPKDCGTCVNLLKGGFTIMNKCDDEPHACQCVENTCLISD